MVFRPNEHMRFPTGERMQSCAAGGMCTSAADLPVVSWQGAGHGTMEKCCAGYQLEMGVLKKCFTQNSSSEQALFIGCKARSQFLFVVCSRQNESIIYLTADPS